MNSREEYTKVIETAEGEYLFNTWEKLIESLNDVYSPLFQYRDFILSKRNKLKPGRWSSLRVSTEVLPPIVEVVTCVGVLAYVAVIILVLMILTL